MKRSVFSAYHPLVIFVYFLGVLVFTMCTMHPIYIGLSFCAAAFYFVFLKGIYAFMKSIRNYLLIFIVVAVVNPLVNHMGLTVLFYLWDNPITLEALYYGMCSGGMLVCIMLWFSCYSEVMTSDKFIALFGRAIPTTAMTLSMILRYIPETIKKSKEIRVAQQALTGGEPISKKEKVAQGINMTSILMSWSMEESIETADSMKSRGYGIKHKRSHAVRQRGNRFDYLLLTVILLLLLLQGFSLVTGVNTITFYPFLSFKYTSVLFYGFYSLFLFIPLILEGKERLSWLRFNL